MKDSSMNFGSRMKEYEFSSQMTLPKRLPVVIRIDGCHFSSYTRGMEKPFDKHIAEAFWETGKYLASKISGCKVVYHQSDEISLLITNYDKLTTQPWFDNKVQKMVSVSASLATAKFNEEIRKHYPKKELATFDSRVYVLPHDEVTNYFLWRERDAIKNSISMLSQANFSNRELHKLNGDQKILKLQLEKNIDWNAIDNWKKRGVCVVKEEYIKNGAIRKKWEVDFNIPIFSEDRDYINRFVYLPQD